MKGFVELLLSDDVVMDFDTEETTLKIENKLMGIEDETTRTRARQALFRCIQPSDPVKQIMQLRVKKLLRSMMMAKVETVTPTMQPLMPRFQRTVAKINRLVVVDRTVHIHTYNKLIKEAALKIKK
jgi:hypothetical protein